jgi:glycosyltransferase involved in cell wall biosynthesis
VSFGQTLNLLSGIGLGATWLYHTIAARRGIPKIADLTQPEYAVAAETKLPRVSIIVPARNEAAMIETAVRSLLAIDYPDYELIVVDDRSEDSTGAILDRLKAEHDRLVVVHVRELPPGWLGKTHAMWSAAQKSTGEWILFSDADVIHAPEALRRAVHYAEQERADHMVLLPTMLMESVGERMMVSFFQAMFIFAYRPWKVRDAEARDSMGVGAFNMVRRSAYEKIGTYQSMRLSVVDDMRLGEKVKQAGLPSRVAFGDGMVAVRWAEGARGVIANLTKNFFAQLHYSPALAVVAALGLLWLHLGPWFGTLLAAGWARAGYAVALGSLLAIYVAMGKRTKIGTGYVLLHPVASVLMVFTLVRSTVVTLVHGGVEWRGTFYPLDELKKNC